MRRFVIAKTEIPFSINVFKAIKQIVAKGDIEFFTCEYMKNCWEQHDNRNQRKLILR